MPLVFRDHQIVVISPGSLTTQVQSGIPDSLGPAQYEVATKVYDLGDGKFSLSGTPEQEVRPLVKGEIANLAAFQYFIKVIYNNLLVLNVPPPALLLVSSVAWDDRVKGLLTKYLFEQVRVPAFALLNSGLAVAYGYATADCVVVDVGHEKTELSFLKDFVVNKRASRIVPVGGQSINEALAKARPDLTESQIEALKCSHIAEVLSAEDDMRRREMLGDVPEGAVAQGTEEEGVVDVMAIVASGRAREILEERERQKNPDGSSSNKEKLNSEREYNEFVDADGVTIKAGKERFTGSELLLNSIIDGICDGAAELSPWEQTTMWQNICITGRGALLHGFRTALITGLEKRILLNSTVAAINQPSNFRANPNSALKQPEGPSLRQTPEELELPVQQPLSIKAAKLSDHFPEWKSENWDAVALLGAQIEAKQIFTTGLEGLFVSRIDYNELGPVSITEVC